MTSLLRSTLLIATVALFATFGLQGCGDDDDNTVAPPMEEIESSFVRLAHLSPDAGLVDIWVDGTRVLRNVDFAVFSPYLELDPGDRRIQVTPAGQDSPVVIDATATLTAETYYTVAAVGPLASIEPAVVVDDVVTSASNAKIRFIHASPDAPNVDITLTDGTVLFGNIAFKESAPFISVPAGDYDLQVRVAGTEIVALSFGDVTLMARTNYTVVAVGLLSDGSLTAKVAVDAPGDGSTVVGLQPATAMVRVAHLSPDAPDVDIYLNDEIIPSLTGVPFQAVSGYLSANAATNNVKVYVTGTTVDPVIDASVTLLPGRAYTVAATGLVGAGDLSPFILVDDRQGASPGNSLVRFVHLSPDAPEVDIVVEGGPTLFDDVGFRTFAGYGEVAAGTYNLEVRLTASNALALPVPGVMLGSGESYTVFAVGLAGDGSLGAVLVRDTP
jgi:hypothetical protein